MRFDLPSFTSNAWLLPLQLTTIVAGCLSLPQRSVGQVTPRVFNIVVLNQENKPLAGVFLDLSNGTQIISAITDSRGKTRLSCPMASSCQVTTHLKAYEVTTFRIGPDSNSLAPMEITLAPLLIRQETVTVKATEENPLALTDAGAVHVPVAAATRDPSRPMTLSDALPLVPGVIRLPDGEVQIGGVGEQHSTLIVNAIDVTNPATGGFGLSVPIDAVDMAKVLQSPYLAQYGSFTQGVVSADTKRGGDKWLYGINDPLPDVRIRSGHLVGLRAFTPRANLSGPLLATRLYLSESTEYLMHKDEVRTLQFPANEIRSSAVNSFTQLDATISPVQVITGTLHIAPVTTRYANLNFFDPQAVTANTSNREVTVALTHHWETDGGVLSTTVAGTTIRDTLGPQAPGEMLLSPTGNSGSYFGQQSERATRTQWIETWAPRTFRWNGSHTWQSGFVLRRAVDQGNFSGSPVRITNGDGNLLTTISFVGPGNYTSSDLELSVYSQDHWILGQHLAIDAGLRWEKESITSAIRIAPRAGFTWIPDVRRQEFVLRGGMGVFYDQVPLNTYAFPSFPQQDVTTYDGDGNVTQGPTLFHNLIGTLPTSMFPLIDHESNAGNFVPYSLAWSIEAEQKIGHSFSLRARYLENNASNQLTLTQEQTPGLSALVLGGSGYAHTHQFELVAVIGPNADHRVYASYVHQIAQGTLTDESEYVGGLPHPVVRSLAQASLPGEVPNRFLAWGTWALPYRFRVSPHIESHTGFPFQVVNPLQQYVASVFQLRYPSYFSLDTNVARDFNISQKHAVRFAVVGLNLTDHANYLQVHNNSGDPQFGTFFGTYGRHFRLDFDFLF